MRVGASQPLVCVAAGEQVKGFQDKERRPYMGPAWACGIRRCRMPTPGSGQIGLIAAAHVANIADDAVASPSQSPATTPGFLVSGADHNGPFRELLLFGGARRRTGIDHEAVLVSSFHDDALSGTNLRDLPNEWVAARTLSDKHEITGVRNPDQGKNDVGIPFHRQRCRLIVPTDAVSPKSLD
jgi:hypothetical protein